MKKIGNTLRWCLSTSLPQIFWESHISLKAFMSFQKFGSYCCPQSKSSLSCRVRGRERWFRVGAEPEAAQRPEHYETHKHTAVCGPPPAVHHNSPLIPLRSAHQRWAAGQSTSTAASGGSTQQNNPGSQPQENAPGGPWSRSPFLDAFLALGHTLLLSCRETSNVSKAMYTPGMCGMFKNGLNTVFFA